MFALTFLISVWGDQTKMKDKIVQLLRRRPKGSLSAREIGKFLQIPAHEKKQLRNKLKDLSDEGLILNVRGKRYGVPSESAKTLTGSIKLHQQGYGFVMPDNKGEKDVFIPARFVGTALPHDHVLISYEEKSDGRREGKVLDVLKRGRTQWTGILRKRGAGYFVLNQDYDFDLEIDVTNTKLNNAKVGERVLVNVSDYGDSKNLHLKGEIMDVLGAGFDEKSDVLALLYKHNIRQDFPSQVLREVASKPQVVTEDDIAGRVDLRLWPIMTIDGINAKDFDDAITVKADKNGFILYVSIADVAHYVERGSLLDQEALLRGTSVYFPDFCIPMLPEKISNHLCSLKPGEDRLTLTCEIHYTARGVMKDAYYYESVIRSRKRGIYEDIQNFYDGKFMQGEIIDLDSEIKRSLVDMKKLALVLMKKREERGALDFDLPAAEIVYDHKGEMTAIVQSKRFFSHRLIEEFMIAANVAVATLFAENNIPQIYRIHDRPDPQKVLDFVHFCKNMGLKISPKELAEPKAVSNFLHSIRKNPMEALMHQMLLRSMKWAKYDSNNVGHYGLSLVNYTHFTSPIRRYPDLLVHRQLKKWINQAPDRKLHFSFSGKKTSARKGPGGAKVNFSTFASEEVLAKLGDQCSRKERDAMEAEREMLDYKRTVFMQQHVDEKFFGTVKRITKFGLFVELEPHYVDGLLSLSELKDDYYEFDEKRLRLVGRRNKNRVYKVGDKLWVKVKEASISQRKIILSLMKDH